jgi:hypothetical protein
VQVKDKKRKGKRKMKRWKENKGRGSKGCRCFPTAARIAVKHGHEISSWNAWGYI